MQPIPPIGSGSVFAVIWSAFCYPSSNRIAITLCTIESELDMQLFENTKQNSCDSPWRVVTTEESCLCFRANSAKKRSCSQPGSRCNCPVN
jgi:hypothetical protein